jgi:heptosyltransferase-2
MPQTARSILIIRYSSMGDVIVAAPLVAVLRTNYPDAHIALLTRRMYADLFKDDRRLSEIFTVDRKELCTDATLTGRVWDMVVDLQHNRQSAAQMATLQFLDSGVFEKLRFERTLLLFLRLNRYGEQTSVAERYILAAKEPLPAGRLDFQIPFEKYSQEDFRLMMRHGEFERPVIALFPFSAWRNKEWGDNSFVSIGQFFSIKGWRIVIMGGRADKERALRMQHHIGKQCISFAGKLSLYDCGRFLRHCSLALGCDTGLSHLARACNVKTGFIFGPTTGHFGFKPEDGPLCRTFERQLFCRPCHAHGGNWCWRIDHACMHSLNPEQVIYGMLDLFDGRSGESEAV